LFVVQGGSVVEFTNPAVLFVFMLAFTVATIAQCFMFSVFFARANLASACSAIFYFIGYLPYALCVQWEEYMENWQKALAVFINVFITRYCSSLTNILSFCICKV